MSWRQGVTVEWAERQVTRQAGEIRGMERELHQPKMTENSRFATTRWSLIVDAGGPVSDNSRKALGELAQQYWYPLYVFARRRGASPEDAQDYTQGFLTKLLEKCELFAQANPQRGRFRAFLIHAFKNFVSNQIEHQRAARRGGGAVVQSLSIDFDDGERRYQYEPVDTMTAERLFERRWALSVLASALDRVGNYYREKGKAEFFEKCRPFLMLDEDHQPQNELAEELGMSEGNLRTSLHRMRQRYRDLLRAEVAETVQSADEVEQELQLLKLALSR